MLVGGLGPEGEGVGDGAAGVLVLGLDEEFGAWVGVGVFEHGKANGDGPEHGGDGGTGDGTDGGLGLLIGEVDVGAGERLEDFLRFGGDALVVEAEGDDGLFADVSGVHSCDDFLAEVAAFGEVDSCVHDA